MFRHPPRLGFVSGSHRRPDPDQLIVRIDPSVGAALVLDGLRPDHSGPVPIRFSADVAETGGSPPMPYEVLIDAALSGDASRFTRQDSVEESWRIVEPLLKRPGRVHPYTPGTWGPNEAAQSLMHGLGRWHEPWDGR